MEHRVEQFGESLLVGERLPFIQPLQERMRRRQVRQVCKTGIWHSEERRRPCLESTRTRLGFLHALQCVEYIAGLARSKQTFLLVESKGHSGRSQMLADRDALRIRAGENEYVSCPYERAIPGGHTELSRPVVEHPADRRRDMNADRFARSTGRTACRRNQLQ